MIDIHCHLLPEIDDGAESLHAAIDMAADAVDAGVETVVATPHLRADFPRVKVDEIADRCADLSFHLQENGIALTLVPGAEVSLGWASAASDAELRLASYGQRGTDLLIETPGVGGPFLPRQIAEVAARGYRITLAHPERLHDLRNDTDTLDELIRAGVRLQVDADALVGPGRRASARFARAYYHAGLITAIASNAHSARRRQPIIGLPVAARDLAAEDGAVARQLVQDGPAAILSGGPLPQIAPLNDAA